MGPGNAEWRMRLRISSKFHELGPNVAKGNGHCPELSLLFLYLTESLQDFRLHCICVIADDLFMMNLT